MALAAFDNLVVCVTLHRLCVEMQIVPQLKRSYPEHTSRQADMTEGVEWIVGNLLWAALLQLQLEHPHRKLLRTGTGGKGWVMQTRSILFWPAMAAACAGIYRRSSCKRSVGTWTSSEQTT